MSTTQSAATNPNPQTDSRGSSHPETRQKQLSKADIAIRSRIRNIAQHLQEATTSEALDTWERGFCADLAARLTQYGPATRLTAEQVVRIEYLLTKAAH